MTLTYRVLVQGSRSFTSSTRRSWSNLWGLTGHSSILLQDARHVRRHQVPSNDAAHDADVTQKRLAYVRQHATRGDAQSVRDVIDKFGYENWMMNVGDVKGSIVDAEIRKLQPKVMVEIGGYCGYSAVRFGNLLREVVDIAGLSDVVKIIVGPFQESIEKWSEVDHVDVFFIDHRKDLYLPDLKLIEKSGLLQQGSVIIADNVITPGAPDYLEYIRAHPKFQSVFHETKLEYSDERDGIEVSTFLG
ncbi:hypothetical protein Poli38472_014327 [Pythium oligandrum]|uniref:catechol O-methyltransferase n=1 Tax=Pythium oligandrum TaxID=41045 RepID=A0A8K1C768_PYTOL|nr:hypothetical protein Poli38472_014327 [Pythium oligandrum]|eukprot:TMW57724.1 hypothetical protein Poli38472_014327 [Pythium oligandrum]